MNCSTRRSRLRCARRRTRISSRGGCSSPRGHAATGWSRRFSRRHPPGSRRPWVSRRAFLSLRQELGALVYGSMGIPRHDAEARRLARLRNWEFFRAPVGAVVCMHRDLGLVDSLGVGMFLQTLLLGLTERGLGTCVQVSIAEYPADRAGSSGHTRRPDRPMRPGDRLSGPRFPGQQPRGTAQSGRVERGVPG